MTRLWIGGTLGNPSVRVAPGLPRTERSHDVSLDDGTEKIGFRFAGGNAGFFQKIPVSDPMRIWSDMQEEWTSGTGLRNFRDDPMGYADGQFLWSMTPRKLFPAPQWFFGKGTRTMDYSMPGSMNWQPLLGSYLYLSRKFTAAANNTATQVRLWVRRVGSPGTLTLKLYSDTSGDPNAALANSTVTKTTSDITDTISELVTFAFPSSQSLTASTVYHVVVYGATTDTEQNHWEIGIDSATDTDSDASADGSTWAEIAFSMYFMVVDAEIARKGYFFNLDGALYFVTKSDDSTVASKLFINGIRGTCTSATAASGTTITCTGKFTAGEYDGAGAKVRIIDGGGDGQIFTITSNTANALTITPAVTVALTTSSRFVVYYTHIWHEITGHGLGQVVSRPATAEKTVWFPQGTGTTMRRGVVAGNSYTWSAELTATKYDFASVHHNKNEGVKVWLANATSCQIVKATPVANTVLTTETARTKVGSGDGLITSLFNSGGKLWVGKEDGLFYVESGTVNEIDSGVKSSPDPTNGLAWTAQGSTMFYSWGHSFSYLIGSETKDILNYRTSFEGLPANRKGYVSAAISVLGWIIVAIDGGTSNYSSIRVWNGRGWNEIFRTWTTGVRIRDLWYQGNPDTRGRLWAEVGGHPVYIDLPLNASNPRNDTALTYCHEGVMVTGTYSVDKDQLYKLIHEIRLTCENLGAGSATDKQWLEIDYQVNDDVESSNWTPLGEVLENSKSVILDRGEVLKIRFRIRILSTVSTVPAVVNNFDVNGTIAAEDKYQYGCTFQVGIRQRTYDQQDDFAPDFLERWCRESHVKRKKLLMRSVLNEADSKTVTISLAMPSYNAVADGQYSGTFQVVLQET